MGWRQNKEWLRKMKRKIVGILVCMLLIVTNIAVLADWDPKDGHKMHFPQLPDPNGWDVWATEPFVCADDWRCSESGYVKDIHFWGSWKDDNEGTIVKFKIWIYSDIPADPNNPYSKPGELLKYLEIRDFTIRGPYQGDQGWYEPVQHYWISHNHQNYYQYNVFLDKEDWFEQERNTIYWLAISAVVIGDEQWGWKSSSNHWNDDACWAYSGEWDWIDLWEPPYDKVSDSYSAQFSYGNDLVQGGGTGFDGMW